MNIISITIGSYPFGEATSNRNISILKGLVELGNNVKLFILSPTNKKCAGDRNKQGIIEGVYYEYNSKTVNWPNSPLKKAIIILRSLIVTIKKLKKIHKDTRIDVLIILLSKPFLMHPFIIFAKYYNIKIIHEQTEHPEIVLCGNKIIGFFKLLYYKLLIKRLNGIYVISQFLKDYFSKFYQPEKICVVNMTVDITRFNMELASPFYFKYIAYCGTMHGNKDGLEYLINSYSQIVEKTDLKMVLIGDNSDKRTNNLKALIKEKKIEDKIVFTGSIISSDIPQYLLNADILVLSRPSNKQAKGGFPSKLGEYLITGKPVIVTSVGEIPLFLKDGENSFLVEPYNVDTFSKKIIYVINNYQEALAVGKEGKKVALTHFNYKTESNKLYIFLSGLIN